MMRLAALVFVAMLAVGSTAEADGRFHHRYGAGERAAWITLGSVLTRLAVSHPHSALVLQPPHRRWRPLVAPVIPVRYYRHHGYSRAQNRRHHRRYRNYQGDRRQRDHGPAPVTVGLSDLHRHGGGAWHVHPLIQLHARHRH